MTLGMHTARLPRASWSRGVLIPVRCANDTPRSNRKDNPRLPKRGYFSLADPAAEVRVRKLGDKFDPAKKGGRWEQEFIWNVNWQKALEDEEARRRQEEEKQKPREEQVEAGGKGFLSLAGSLDDMDLTEELRRIKEAKQAASSSSEGDKAGGGSGGKSLMPVGSRQEVRKLERVSRSAARGATISLGLGKADEEEKARIAALEREKYEQLKLEFQAWTLAIIGLGAAVSYVFYSKELCISYCTGALGGLLYLRLLGRSVDGVGMGGVASVLGQPRLVIPVLLALVYSRWNELFADDYGFQLQLLPMLVGFFTYKLGVVGRQSVELMNEITQRDTASIRAGKD